MSARIDWIGWATAVVEPACAGPPPHWGQSWAKNGEAMSSDRHAIAAERSLLPEEFGSIIARHHKRRPGNSHRRKGVCAQSMNPKIRGFCASLVLLISLTAPAFAQEHPPAPSDASRPVRSPGNAEWAKNWKEAQSTAAAQKKLVFYEFDAPNCGACQRMQGLLYPTSA